MAAIAAAESGARVILADEQNEFGGGLLSATAEIDGMSCEAWIQQIVERLAALGNVTLLPRSTVFGYHDHNFLTIAERCADHVAAPEVRGPRQRLWRVRARQVVLAQGAFERPLVFCNNDRPGVMLASAVSTYINRYAVRPGERAVIFTNNDSAYQTALDLAKTDAVVVVVDSRAGGAGGIGDQARAAGVTVFNGHVVSDVIGRSRVSGVRIASWSGNPSETVKSTIKIDCDLVAVSGGWNPAVHLHSQAGGRNTWDEGQHCFVPGERSQANVSAGACNGKRSLQACLEDGLDAGVNAAASCGLDSPALKVPSAAGDNDRHLEPLWRVPAERDPDRCAKQFLDFQNDTSVVGCATCGTRGLSQRRTREALYGARFRY